MLTQRSRRGIRLLGRYRERLSRARFTHPHTDTPSITSSLISMREYVCRQVQLTTQSTVLQVCLSPSPHPNPSRACVRASACLLVSQFATGMSSSHRRRRRHRHSGIYNFPIPPTFARVPDSNNDGFSILPARGNFV